MGQCSFGLAQEVDASAANTLARAGNCFHCHSVDKAKKAPSFVRIAQKYAGNPEALAILEKHLTAGEAVKVEGEDEKHTSPPAKSPADLHNLIRWILSRG